MRFSEHSWPFHWCYNVKFNKTPNIFDHKLSKLLRKNTHTHIFYWTNEWVEFVPIFKTKLSTSIFVRATYIFHSHEMKHTLRATDLASLKLFIQQIIQIEQLNWPNLHSAKHIRIFKHVFFVYMYGNHSAHGVCVCVTAIILTRILTLRSFDCATRKTSQMVALQRRINTNIIFHLFCSLSTQT